YTPYSTLPNKEIVKNSISFTSASKSFSLAAMKCAYMFSTNADYIARIKASGPRQELNTLGMVASRAAYDHGEDWLEQCVAYIDGTHDYVESFVRANIPLIRWFKPQRTFFGWLNAAHHLE